MYRRHWLPVLVCVAALSQSANATVERDAAAIADRYRAAMQRKGYAFLSKDELSNRRDQVARFVAAHLNHLLDEPTLEAILEGIDRCIDRLYYQPAGKLDYRGGFGTVGEEWMYLNDRDYFRTFQYHLWRGLVREPLMPVDLQRRDTQRQWMRAYLTNLPHRGKRETLPRDGMNTDDVRPSVQAELEQAFTDPLHPLSQPLPDEGFAKLQDRFNDFSNGIWDDFHHMEVAALTSRFVSQEDPSARHGYRYTGELPFKDVVVGLWGNGPHLRFASNADFCGNYGILEPSVSYDVIRCITIRPASDSAPATHAPDAPLAIERRGELTVDDSTLVAVRGAKLAELPVKTWFDADELSDDQLATVIRNGGSNRISIQCLPTVNGMHRGDRTEGEFFVVVKSRENRLAVICLASYERGQLFFWCRPRPASLNSGAQ